MHARLSTSLVIGLLLTACSGGSGLSSSADKAPASKTQNSSAATDPSPSPSADAAADSESSKSTAPVQVTGAFLTSRCDIAAAGEFAAMAGQDAYGCAINKADGTKYTGAVQFNSIKVTYAKSPAVSAGLNPSSPASRWHTYFYLPSSERGQIYNYELSGTLDSQRQFNLNYAPGAATSTGTITAQASPAACVPSLDFTATTVYPYSMDAQNAKDYTRLVAGTAGGSPVPVLNANGGFKPGDRITGSFSGSSAVAIDKSTGVADPQFIYQCDYSGWKLYFQDSSLNILNTANGDIAAWLKTGGSVPANAVTATVGYSEPGDKTYRDNEGDLLDLGLHAIRIGGGCTYSFHIERSCK